MGEVNCLMFVLLKCDGCLMLSDVLLQVGSINFNIVDVVQMFVICGVQGCMLMVFYFDVCLFVVMVFVNQFELELKDIVYVDGNGFVCISCVLSLLLFSVNMGVVVGIVMK